MKHPFQLFGVAAAHSVLQQLLAGFVAGSSLLTRKQILLRFFGSNRGTGKGKRRDDGVGLSTVPAADSKDLQLVLVVVFEVVAVSRVAAFGPTRCTDHPSQNRGPMRIQFGKAIVRSGNVEYYYCIKWGSRAAFNGVYCPVSFILSFSSQIQLIGSFSSFLNS